MTYKKFFTLIHGDQVHIAPKTKVIPADEFSQLQSGAELIERVKIDAEKYKKDIVAEIEVLKEKAQKEGYEAGFQKWAEHVAKLEAEIIKVRKDVERTVVPVALKAAKKIVGREVELSDYIIVDIVANNLKAVASHKKITVYVNKKDLDVLDRNKAQLKQLFESLESFTVRARSDVQPGGCIIETEGGIINAQLENQWRILENAFESLKKTK